MAATKRAGRGPLPFTGLRGRLLLSLAAAILLAALALTAAGALTLLAAGREAGAAVNEAQLQAAREALMLQNRELAGQAAAGLQQAARDLDRFAALLGAALAREDDSPAGAFEFTLLPGGQQVASPSASVEVFASNRLPLETEELESLARRASLDELWRALEGGSPQTLRAYYGSTDDLLFLYPNQGLGSSLPPDFTPSSEGWYLAAGPENNPEGAARWIPAHPDFTGEAQVISLSLPVYTAPGEFAGAVGLDLTLEQALAPLQVQELYPGSYSFLVDSQGRAFGLPAQGFVDFLGRPPEPGEIFAPVQAAAEAFTPLLARMLTAEVGYETLRSGERNLVIAYAPLEGTSWSVGTVVEAGNLLPQGGAAPLPGAGRRILTRLLPAGLGAALLALALCALAINRLWKRLETLSDTADQILAGDWSTPIPRSGNDEIGVLESLLESLRSQLHRTEWERVRTRYGEQHPPGQPERAARLLQATAKAGRLAAGEQGPDALLEQIVQAAAREFGCRYAALHLLEGSAPHLRAAYSPPEEDLPAAAAAAGPGAPLHLALETGEPQQAQDDDHAVLAVPLLWKGRTLGALELYRAGEEPFTGEERELLEALAGVTALAVQHAALSEALRKGPGGLPAPNGASGPQPSRPAAAYQFDRRQVRPIQGLELDPQTTQRLQAGEMVVLQGRSGDGAATSQLLAPIRLLDKTIGVIGFEAPDPAYTWGAEQLAMIESLAGQAALALENARLLEEAQKRAAEERLISEVTWSIRETLDIDRVLQTAAQEIRGRLNLQEVTIRLGEDA